MNSSFPTTKDAEIARSLSRASTLAVTYLNQARRWCAWHETGAPPTERVHRDPAILFEVYAHIAAAHEYYVLSSAWSETSDEPWKIAAKAAGVQDPEQPLVTYADIRPYELELAEMCGDAWVARLDESLDWAIEAWERVLRGPFDPADIDDDTFYMQNAEDLCMYRDSLEWAPQGIMLCRLESPDRLTPLKNLGRLVKRTAELDARLDEVLLGRRPERFFPAEGFWWRQKGHHPARRA